MRLSVRSWSLVWMVGGSALMIFALVFLNRAADPPERHAHESEIVFNSVQQAAKPKVQPQRPKPPKAKPRQAPPTPLLDSNLSGISLDLFDLGNSGQVDDALLGNLDNVVMSGDMVDVLPRARLQTPVEYPPRAKAKSIEGYVVLSLLINTQGRVQAVEVLEAEPLGYFEDQARRTVQQWVFEPAEYKGKAVKSWAKQTIRFELG